MDMKYDETLAEQVTYLLFLNSIDDALTLTRAVLRISEPLESGEQKGRLCRVFSQGYSRFDGFSKE